MASIIKIGDKYVEFVTEDRLVLTDDPNRAGAYSWEGQIQAKMLIDKHLNALGDQEYPVNS